MGERRTRRVPAWRSRWTRFGVVGVLVFLVKGLLWLIVPALFWLRQQSAGGPPGPPVGEAQSAAAGVSSPSFRGGIRGRPPQCS